MGGIIGRLNRVWNAQTGVAVLILSGHTNWVMSVAYSPDGRFIASGSKDNTIIVWDTTSWEEVATLGPASDTPIVSSVTFSPTGNAIATENSGDIVIWTTPLIRSIHTYMRLCIG